MTDPDYFTIDEFATLPDSAIFQDGRILEVAAALTATIEREVGTSFVPRTYTESLSVCDQDSVVLANNYAQSITSLVVNGSTVDPTTMYVYEGVLQYRSLFRFYPSGQRGNLTITYTAGYPDGVPADIKEHLMWAVRDRLLATDSNAGIDARRTSVVTELGTVNYVLAGQDRPTGYPDLDAAIIGWRNKLDGPSVG